MYMYMYIVHVHVHVHVHVYVYNRQVSSPSQRTTISRVDTCILYTMHIPYSGYFSGGKFS